VRSTHGCAPSTSALLLVYIALIAWSTEDTPAASEALGHLSLSANGQRVTQPLLCDGIGSAWTIALGYSTGHVGTTTLCDPATYESSHDCPRRLVEFGFEQLGRDIDKRRLRVDHRKHHGTVSFQTSQLRRHYLPMVRGRLAKGKRVWVDLSHMSIFLMDGFVDLLLSNPADSLLVGLNLVKLVRVRRARLETAISWCIPPKQTNCYDTNFEDSSQPIAGAFVLSPNEGYPVELPLPNMTAWEELTGIQRAMWYADEIEARWQRIGRQVCRGAVAGAGSGALSDSPHLAGPWPCLEVTWTKARTPQAGNADQLACPVTVTDYGSIVSAVAEFIGLRAAAHVQDHRHHTKLKVSAVNQNTSLELFPEAMELHGDYLRKMHFNASTLRLIQAQLACL